MTKAVHRAAGQNNIFRRAIASQYGQLRHPYPYSHASGAEGKDARTPYPVPSRFSEGDER